MRERSVRSLAFISLTLITALAACSGWKSGRHPGSATTIPMDTQDASHIQRILQDEGFARGLQKDEPMRISLVECNRDRFILNEDALLCTLGEGNMRKQIRGKAAGLFFAIMQKYTSIQDYPGAIFIKLARISCNRDISNSACETELP